MDIWTNRQTGKIHIHHVAIIYVWGLPQQWFLISCGASLSVGVYTYIGIKIVCVRVRACMCVHVCMCVYVLK